MPSLSCKEIVDSLFLEQIAWQSFGKHSVIETPKPKKAFMFFTPPLFTKARMVNFDRNPSEDSESFPCLLTHGFSLTQVSCHFYPSGVRLASQVQRHGHPHKNRTPQKQKASTVTVPAGSMTSQTSVNLSVEILHVTQRNSFHC